MNIYVGNLPFRHSSEDLAAMFRRFGVVTSAQVMVDRETGRSRGFGFVEMEDDEAARKAIEELDGNDIGGRQITVNEARPRQERGPRQFGDRPPRPPRPGGGGGGGFGGPRGGGPRGGGDRRGGGDNRYGGHRDR